MNFVKSCFVLFDKNNDGRLVIGRPLLILQHAHVAVPLHLTSQLFSNYTCFRSVVITFSSSRLLFFFRFVKFYQMICIWDAKFSLGFFLFTWSIY